MNTKPQGKIYLITNKANGKLYVGQTITKLEYRLSKHFSDSIKANSTTAIGSAIRKHGKENFIISLLENVDYDNLNEREAFWIKTLDTYNKGYNRVKRSNHDRQELDDIVKEFIDGKPQTHIEKEYHICRKTLKHLLEQQGIDTNMNNVRHTSSSKKEKILLLYKQGKSIRDIQKEIGGCRKTISKYIKEAGIEIPKGNLNKYNHPYKK